MTAVYLINQPHLHNVTCYCSNILCTIAWETATLGAISVMSVLLSLCPGDVFYVIEEGTFTIFDNSGRELARVSKGSCFGELALMHQASVMIDNNCDSRAVPFLNALS